MAWVEDQIPPGKVVASYRTNASATSPVTRTRAIFRYPATSVWTGQGNVNNEAFYVPGPPTPGVSDVTPWLGLKHYKPSAQEWCDVVNGKVLCQPGTARKGNR